jgi:integrase
VAHFKQKLMPLTVSKLQPMGKQILVWDTIQHGLVLRVQPSGYRSYVLVYRYRNRPRWFTIARADAIGLADARVLAAKLMLEVITGKDPQAEKRASRSSGTFAEIADRYLEEYAKKKNKSWKQADKLVRFHLLPKWGSLIAKEITRADVRTAVSKLPPITANQVLASASAIFTWAIKQDLLNDNPCRGVERNATVSRERVLSDVEVPMFWEAFRKAGLPGKVLQVLLLTGQRPGEVMNMRYDQIADGWWTLPGKPDEATGWPGTKNGNTHRVWLPQSVREIVEGLNVGADDGLVFGFSPLLVQQAMQTIYKQLKVERATPHDLRRTHGSTITGLGFGRDAMNRIQNHREGGIADVYDRHSYSEENKKVMATVASHILSLAEGGAPTNVIKQNFKR